MPSVQIQLVTETALVFGVSQQFLLDFFRVINRLGPHIQHLDLQFVHLRHVIKFVGALRTRVFAFPIQRLLSFFRLNHLINVLLKYFSPEFLDL